MKAEAKTNPGDSCDTIELKYQRLEDRLTQFLSDLPMFGFNSGCYDLQLIKTYVVRYLLKSEANIVLLIRKSNNFMCIQTDTL